MINFDNIGLVDLHLHLDGSLSVDSVKELMQIQGIKIVTVIVNFWRNFRSLMDAEI